mmetsp:Transcript_12458/g.10722  ORF Transcript_12458/g.10722 Transcript_12458/m.10722 type:complete len:191 (+) Transcript_12458:90-662(+)
MQFIKFVGNFYTKQMDKRPLFTKVGTAVFTSTTSDMLAQFGIEKRTFETYQFKRTFNMMMISTMFMVPWAHIWHSRAVPYITNMFQGSTFKKTTACLVADYSTLSPFLLSAHLFLVEAFKTLDFKAGMRSVQCKFGKAYKSNLAFWPAVSAISYSLVPANYRILFGSVIGLFWGVYMNQIANQRHSAESN